MLNIPKPCNEDWNKMNPTQQGAFCGSCQKEVVDFTSMTDEQVLHFLSQHAGKKLCGRATITQVNRLKIVINENVLYSNIRTWKKYLAILLICFCSAFVSCTNENTVGKLKVENDNIRGNILVINTTFKTEDTSKKDTIIKLNTKTNNIPNIPLLQIIETPTHITGEIAPPPEVQPQEIMGKILEPHQEFLPKDSMPIKKVDSCSSQIFS
jgi:hypothetical protein